MSRPTEPRPLLCTLCGQPAPVVDAVAMAQRWQDEETSKRLRAAYVCSRCTEQPTLPPGPPTLEDAIANLEGIRGVMEADRDAYGRIRDELQGGQLDAAGALLALLDRLIATSVRALVDIDEHVARMRAEARAPRPTPGGGVVINGVCQKCGRAVDAPELHVCPGPARGPTRYASARERETGAIDLSARRAMREQPTPHYFKAGEFRTNLDPPPPPPYPLEPSHARGDCDRLAVPASLHDAAGAEALHAFIVHKCVHAAFMWIAALVEWISSLSDNQWGIAPVHSRALDGERSALEELSEQIASRSVRSVPWTNGQGPGFVFPSPAASRLTPGAARRIAARKPGRRIRPKKKRSE